MLQNFFQRCSQQSHFSFQLLCESESHSVVYDSLWLLGLYSPWNSLGQNTGVGSFSLLQGIFPTQEIEPMSPALQANSLPAEPQGKPKNTGVGSLSFLQQLFPTQGLNRGLLHCRLILYQLSYQGISCYTHCELWTLLFTPRPLSFLLLFLQSQMIN